VLAFLVLLCGIPAERRRWKGFLGMALVLLVLASGTIACGGAGSGGGGGGGSGNPGTTPGNYIITVTGTIGTLTRESTLTLTVK